MATKFGVRGKKGGSTARSAALWVLTRVLLPLGLLYGLLWWRADAAVERQLDRLRTVLDIQRGPTVLGLNGDIGSRNLVVRPLAGSSLPGLTLTADRAVVQTPGLFWLARTSLFGLPDEIPSRLGFELEGASIDGDAAALQAAMVGGHVLFPFDLAGCEPSLTLEVARELGLDQAVNDFTFTLLHAGGDDVRMEFAAHSPAFSKVSGEVVLGLGKGDAGMRLATATFKSLAVQIADEGFVAKRNQYCARKLGIDVAAFVPRHVDAVRAAFAADGLVPGAAMSQAYAGFSEHGGQLSVQAKPLRAGPFLEMKGITLANMGLFFDATVKHDDNFTAPLVFLGADEVGPAVPAEGVAPAAAVAPAQAGAEAAAAANVAPAAPGEQKPAQGTTSLAPGDEIAFDALPGHVGSEVLVETNLGTQRRGVLTGASSISLVIKLVAAEGGFSLSMPKNNIVKVRLAPPLTETPDGQANAQAQ